MRIVFISNKLTPHQIPLCNELSVKTEFRFIETLKAETVEIGWRAERREYPYVIPYTEEKREQESNQKIIMDADVVIIGSAPDKMIIPRLKAGKLTFKYAERFYKQDLNARNFLHALLGAWLHHGRFQKYPLYMLCSSAYTAADCALLGNYFGKTYKWGYFPEMKCYDIDGLMRNKSGVRNTEVSILWVGRLIEWKHPESAILLAESLKYQGYNFKLSIIGYGPLEQKIQSMVDERELSDCVQILGAMSTMEVRTYMEKADIFLFTSDFNEGWGAVLNESMNSGCAVVASHAIGAVPFLIKNGENGLIYQSGSQAHLEKQVKKLLQDAAYRKKLGKKGYETIASVWNADVAACRFIELSAKILNGEKSVNLYDSGPCSKAEILENNWFQDGVTGK